MWPFFEKKCSKLVIFLLKHCINILTQFKPRWSLTVSDTYRIFPSGAKTSKNPSRAWNFNLFQILYILVDFVKFTCMPFLPVFFRRQFLKFQKCFFRNGTEFTRSVPPVLGRQFQTLGLTVSFQMLVTLFRHF